MGAEDNGLTLQGLAQRLEAQTQRLEALERENTELRDEVTALRGPGSRRGELAERRGSDTSRSGESASEFEGRVSRRALLSKAGAAAVAVVAAGTLLGPREAKANHSTARIEADRVVAHTVLAVTPGASDSAAIFGWIAGSGQGVAAVNGLNTGSGPGVKGVGDTGVRGESSTIGHAAVLGKHSEAGFNAYGIKGETVEGVGVKGTGKVGVIGESPTLGHASVYGQHVGSSGYGVVGDGTGASAGVLGRNSSGSGVQGTGRYGGLFEGSRSQLRLVPKTTAGKPTGAHTKGEIYMDSAGTLFVCTVGGNPATWRRVQTVAT